MENYGLGIISPDENMWQGSGSLQEKFSELSFPGV
jgi:hypothetical protein